LFLSLSVCVCVCVCVCVAIHKLLVTTNSPNLDISPGVS